jgi:hypothetical protein
MRVLPYSEATSNRNESQQDDLVLTKEELHIFKKAIGILNLRTGIKCLERRALATPR